MAVDEGRVKIEKYDGKQPEGMKNEDWAILDRQALGVIRLTLSRNVAFNIAKEKTTAGLMAALSSIWNTTVTTFSSSSGNNKLKFDHVRDLVLSEEIQQRESGEALSSSALHTESRGRTSERNSNRGRSKSKRGKSRTGKKDFTYYNCGKKGHFKRYYRALKKDTGAQESTNMIEETGDDMILSVNITSPAFGIPLLAVKVTTLGMASSHSVTGGVYKAREQIHRRMAGRRLLEILHMPFFIVIPHVISVRPPDSNDIFDALVWRWNLEHQFTIKSPYVFLMEADSCGCALYPNPPTLASLVLIFIHGLNKTSTCNNPYVMEISLGPVFLLLSFGKSGNKGMIMSLRAPLIEQIRSFIGHHLKQYRISCWTSETTCDCSNVDSATPRMDVFKH
ncbi:ORF65c [Hibiscus syriacus]|uniref:ORF65c n=1 Tax=Hibiscus syriacus TaxID=106335 RepID=A0A6A2YW35_HIBSY|nr:ORF65c [Hibiscus syriacus]